jgi:ABC-2 type transport system permease protein
MTWLVFRLTVGQLVRQRRTLLLILLAVLPVALAVLFRFAGETAEEAEDFVVGVLAHFIVALVLPLTALVIGTAALGQELEDGTIVYLVAKPLRRWNVVIAKVAAAWVVTTAVIAPSVVASGFIILSGNDDGRLVPAFTVAAAIGALVYAALFVSLSIRFGRALIIGLAYVFLWETLVSQFIVGVRFFSVRAYTTSLADAISDSSSSLFANSLGVTPALVLIAVVTGLSLVYGIRRLNAYQMSERV